MFIVLFDNLPKPFFELYYLGINVSTTPAIFSLFHLMGNTYDISNLFLFNDLREERSMPLINDSQVLHVLKDTAFENRAAILLQKSIQISIHIGCKMLDDCLALLYILRAIDRNSRFLRSFMVVKQERKKRVNVFLGVFSNVIDFTNALGIFTRRSIFRCCVYNLHSENYASVQMR